MKFEQARRGSHLKDYSSGIEGSSRDFVWYNPFLKSFISATEDLERYRLPRQVYSDLPTGFLFVSYSGTERLLETFCDPYTLVSTRRSVAVVYSAPETTVPIQVDSKLVIKVLPPAPVVLESYCLGRS